MKKIENPLRCASNENSPVSQGRTFAAKDFRISLYTATFGVKSAHLEILKRLPKFKKFNFCFIVTFGSEKFHQKIIFLAQRKFLAVERLT
jgi:hypothetical protein